MKFKKIFFEEINSTNTYLIENYENHEHFTVVVSQRQTQGKGQKGNKWESELGGLYFSILLKTSKIDPLISLITGLSVLETLKEFSKKDFKIKWPNDILIDNKKISGVLVESKVKNNEVKCIVVGVGINLNQKKLINNATSLKKIENKEFSILEVLDKFLVFFHNNLNKNNNLLLKSINDNLFGKNNFFDILINNIIIRAKILYVNNEGYLLVNSDNREINILSGKIII